MKVLIVGDIGFLGAQTALAFGAAGWDSVLFGTCSRQELEALKGFPGVTVILSDPDNEYG